MPYNIMYNFFKTKQIKRTKFDDLFEQKIVFYFYCFSKTKQNVLLKKELNLF